MKIKQTGNMTMDRAIKGARWYGQEAQTLADRLNEWLVSTDDIPNLDDYLDSYDMENIGKCIDVLYDFAHMFINDVDRGVFNGE